MSPYREEEQAGVEADGGACEAGDCGEPGEVATPAGLLCREHADELAAELGERRRPDRGGSA